MELVLVLNGWTALGFGALAVLEFDVPLKLALGLALLLFVVLFISLFNRYARWIAVVLGSAFKWLDRRGHRSRPFRSGPGSLGMVELDRCPLGSNGRAGVG